MDLHTAREILAAAHGEIDGVSPGDEFDAAIDEAIDICAEAQ
jgi:hypothetical protein